MKVCFITSSFARYPGDHATPWLVRLIEELRPRGVEVEVFAPSFRGLRQDMLGSIPVRRFRYWPASGEDLTHEDTAPDRMGSLLFALKVAAYTVCGVCSSLLFFGRRRFDALHVHWPFPQGFFAAAALLMNRGARVVFHFHGSEIFLAERRPMLAAAFRLLLPLADELVANSELTAGAVRRVLNPAAEIKVIPFGTTLPAAASRPSPGGAPRLLFAGRLIPRKGLSYLLEALRLLKDSGTTAALRVAGDGPLRERLEKEASGSGLAGQVSFLGYLPAGSAELAREYAACDVFVFTSITDELGNGEGLGMTAVDAMLAGKPVLAFASGGIASFIEDGVSGFLVREKDAAGLAEKLRQIISDPPAAARAAGEGRRRARERFSWEKISVSFMELYGKKNK